VKGSSFEKFNYALRPAKNIERKMFCEAFGRLARIGPLSSYRYVGFGGIGFHDFCLFHQRLGIIQMVSIEGNENAKDRITHNVPYSCIQMQWGLSHEVLPTLDWSSRSIVWLDYERPLETKQLSDVALLAGALVSGSVLIVTVPADPGEVDGKEDMHQKRLDALRSRVGKGHVTTSLEASSLAKWGMARATREIIVNQILKTLTDRNSALESGVRVTFSQLFNFHYADGSKMLSVGGLMLDEEDRLKLSEPHFQDLDFYRPADDPYLIESPLLTWREIKLLDALLPGTAPEVPEPAWIPEKERKKYGKVYRYFPAFGEVET